MNPYIGHASQLYGVEEHRLVGGKGDGMRLLQIRNGKGMELTVSPDRCADISRVSIDGMNVSYFSPCGYVAPAYYQKDGTDWLKSFTAGFLTTCGLEAAGSPCVDEGEVLPLHGSVANTPAAGVVQVNSPSASSSVTASSKHFRNASMSSGGKHTPSLSRRPQPVSWPPRQRWSSR